MIVGGIIAIIVAAVCGYFAYRARGVQDDLAGTETLSVKELGGLRDAAVQAAGPGAFAHRCEVVGEAQPGPDGAITSELAEVPCVWYRHVVTRKYWVTRRDSNGGRQRYEKQETVASNESMSPFLVHDDTGAVLVDLAGTVPDGAEKIVDRFEQSHDQSGAELNFGQFRMNLTSGRDGTHGYNYEEWVLRTGRRLFVHGEATDARGDLVITKPTDGGTFVVSTKDEAQVLKKGRTKQQVLTGAAAVLGVLGIVLVVISLVG